MAREDGCVCRYIEEIGASYLARTEDLTPGADRMRDAGGEKWYRLDRAA
jgi:hypothetical protein